jgi:predicted alpha/beta-fold hydrolase
LSVRRCSTFSFYRLRFIFGMVALWCLTIYLYVHSQNGNGGSNDLMGHPGIDIATIQQGLYFSSDNVFMSRVAEVWPDSERSYSYSRQRHSSSNSSTLPAASPFPTGDALTGIPFLTNSAPELKYHRLWVQSEVDPEAVAIDIAFPPDGVHRSDKDKPVYLILHGLSGGSHEEYVRELAVRRTREGHTCIVMIARGMMDTPIFGWNIFHGARITDVDASAKAIRKALAPDQLLAGVGFSMGAIIISNYVARSGSDCHLDAAVAISGGLDMRENLNFRRSMRLWQPMLAQTLLEDFVKAKFDGRFRQRLTKEQHLYLMRASSVSEVDIHGIVTYNGFDSLNHYYSEMSAMGDTNMFQSKHVNGNGNDGVDNGNGKHGSSRKVGRIGNVSIPFCVVHARDDPLTTWRTMGHDPERLVRTGSGNIMMLLTDAGGHVGWPLGINPRAHGWRFMNDVAAGFINSVNTVRKTTRTRIEGEEEQQQ